MKTGKRILKGRIRGDTSFGDKQLGFMPDRGTTDAIFALRKMEKKNIGRGEDGCT